jgi:predicted HNH restriction endonuclease
MTMLGKKHTEESKQKMILSSKNRKHKPLFHTEETKKKLSIINKGKKLSVETKIKISQSELGEKNSSYIDGRKINDSSCVSYVRRFLYNHDYKYCEMCGVSGCHRYEVHHIVYRSEKPNHKELNNHKNLILLCVNCHKKLHKDKKLRNGIVKKRDLEKLFDDKLLR